MQNGRVVNFFSRHLNPAQQRYSATMRESCAMVESILHYRVYLVYTDDKPLVEWFNLTQLSEMYAKFVVKSQGLAFDVKYVEGERNVLADLMSRSHDVARSTLEDFHKMLHANALHVENYVTSRTKSVIDVPLCAVELMSIFDWVKAEQTSEILTLYKIPEDHVIEIDTAYFYQPNTDAQPRLIVPPECTKSITVSVIWAQLSV